jgi:NTE family protein
LNFNNIAKRDKKTEKKNLQTRYAIIFLSSFLFFLSSFSIHAQDSIKKPKIGLVLSGGGAKGLAHIGVLKVIDSLNIKIDYIGGTSMGAIVGGLYASGYSADDLELLFSKIDTDALIQDYIPRNSKAFNQKRNDEVYLIALPFKNFKISAPTGLSKGVYNFNLLSRYTYHVKEIRDFSKFKIPFFCIATDIETGKDAVLKEGILSQAIVASGAIPSLYYPVEIDGKLLVDGGVSNNYPVEHLRAIGADIVIGVDVQDGLLTRENLNGITDVLIQISNFPTDQKTIENIKLTDIYIKPNIKGYNVFSFDKAQEIIKTGKEAAVLYLDQLKVLKENKKIEREKVTFSDSVYINNIVINPLKNYTEAYVKGKLNLEPNSKISFEKFEKGINGLNASENFSAIYYDFDADNNLNFTIKENQINTLLKAGLHFDDLFKTGILLNYTHKKLISKNDYFSLDVVLGDNFRYNLDYYLDNGFYWSFGVNSKYTSFNRNIKTDFNNGTTFSDLNLNSINIDFSDISHQAFLQTLFSKKFIIGGGCELKHLKFFSPTIQNITPIFDNSDYFSVFGFVKYDSFDNKYFPKSGWYFNGELKNYIFSSNYTNLFEPFSIIKGDAGFVKTFSKRYTFKIQSEAGTAIGVKSIPYFDFILGGYGFSKVNNLQPFYGYDFLSLSGDSYIKGSLMFQYEFYKKNYVNITANYANIGNNVFESKQWISKPNFSGYALGYGYDSIIGPMEVKYSWSPEVKENFLWFSIGYWF